MGKINLIIKIKMGKIALLQLIDEKGKIHKNWELSPGEEYLLGRSPDIDLTVNHYTISRKHVKVSVTRKGGISFEDLNSSNGTFYENKRVKPGHIMILTKGNFFKVGECPCEVKFIDTIDRDDVGEKDQSNEKPKEKSKKLAFVKAQETQNSETLCKNKETKEPESNRKDDRERSREKEFKLEDRLIKD